MKIPFLIIAVICLSIMFSHAQTMISIMPIANDSAIQESNPYLTKYWYSGYIHNNFDCVQTEKYSPIWLCYTEQDSNSTQRVVAKNISVGIYGDLLVSDKEIIFESSSGVKLKNPVIENFLGKPVAIWIEEDKLSTKIKYSMFSDNEWSAAQEIIDAATQNVSFIFLTTDSYNLLNQTSLKNYLVWHTDSTIYQSSLDSLFNWAPPDQVYKSHNQLASLNINQNANNDIWLLYDEKPESDSVSVQALILKEDSSKWKGPFNLLRLEASCSQAAVNASDQYSNDYPLALSWVENNCFHDTLLSYVDSLTYTQLNYFPSIQNFQDFNLTSNHLLLGGCVVAPSPYYLLSYNLDSMYYLQITQSTFYGPIETAYQTKNRISELTLSGFDDPNFAGAWVEYDGEQSDIYLYLGYISIGSIDNENTALPSSNILNQNWPNPFNPFTRFSYFLANAQPIEINLYDVQGRKVIALYHGYQLSGNHSLGIDGRNLASGVYFYSLKTESSMQIRKCILLK